MPVSDNPRDFTWGKRKRNITLWIIGSLVVVCGLVIAGYLLFGKKDSEGTHVNTNVAQQEAPDQSRRALDGVMVPTAEANQLVWGVMIDNISSARPQSGISKAGVVYEALAEGGITRLLALFATTENIGSIGPVRSARPYFVEWAKEYNAMYAHVGGSPQGLQRITELSVKDFNQFYNAGAFKEVKGKVAPHHVYTDSRLLTFGARDRKYESSSYASWKFKEEAPLSARAVDAKGIKLDFSTFPYEVSYAYDRTTNAYKRSQGGTPYIDEMVKEQVAVKNILVQFVSITNFDTLRLNIETTGSGKAIIMRDGETIEGTWKKQNDSSRTTYYDADGAEVVLNAGSTWVEILEKDRSNYSYL